MTNQNLTKVCRKCKVEKSVNEFYSNKAKKDGLNFWCKTCVTVDISARKNTKEGKIKASESVKRYYRRNRTQILAKIKKDRQTLESKAKRRAYLLQKNYKLSLADYHELSKKQNDRCLICGIHQYQTTNGLVVDHCHITGKIRGLLCNICNSAIGKLKDSPELLRKAIEYLENNL